MGYPRLARGGVPPLYNKMMEQGVVTDPMFSFWISKNRASTVGGLLTLGGYNSQFFTGDISWNSVTVQDYWQIGMDSMRVEGRRGTIACDRVSHRKMLSRRSKMCFLWYFVFFSRLVALNRKRLGAQSDFWQNINMKTV